MRIEKGNRPFRRTGYLVDETLSSPKRTIDTVALYNIKKMNLVFESDGAFRFLDYHISHKQLLIRGENIEGEQNIDLIFEGTDIVNCPTDFIGVKIYQLNEEEIKNRKIDNRYGFSRVFLLIIDNQEYHIKTGIMRIYKNSLTLDESSIDMTGNGQENLIWMSTN